MGGLIRARCWWSEGEPCCAVTVYIRHHLSAAAAQLGCAASAAFMSTLRANLTLQGKPLTWSWLDSLGCGLMPVDRHLQEWTRRQAQIGQVCAQQSLHAEVSAVHSAGFGSKPPICYERDTSQSLLGKRAEAKATNVTLIGNHSHPVHQDPGQQESVRIVQRGSNTDDLRLIGQSSVLTTASIGW